MMGIMLLEWGFNDDLENENKFLFFEGKYKESKSGYVGKFYIYRIFKK